MDIMSTLPEMMNNHPEASYTLEVFSSPFFHFLNVLSTRCGKSHIMFLLFLYKLDAPVACKVDGLIPCSWDTTSVLGDVSGMKAASRAIACGYILLASLGVPVPLSALPSGDDRAGSTVVPQKLTGSPFVSSAGTPALSDCHGACVSRCSSLRLVILAA